MKKGGSRMHTKRVSAAPKERRCGVPCTLLVAAWSLFLLLLLTSSISHRDEQDEGFYADRPWRALFWSKPSRQILFGPADDDVHGGQRCFVDGLMTFRSAECVERDKADDGIFPRFAALEKSALGTQEVIRGRLVEECDQVGDSGDPSITLDSGSLSLSAKHDEKLSCSHVNGNDKDRPSSLDAAVHPPRITFQEFGQPINALQYAEYGAELLQKSGPIETNSKICLIGNPGGTHYRMISHHDEFAGQKCLGPEVAPHDQNLPCLNEILAEKVNCHDARRYGGDVVAELEPGESYLVCQSNPSAGTVTCDIACISQSECFLSGADLILGDYDGSIRGLFRHACRRYQGLGQLEASIAESGMASEIPNGVVVELLPPSSQSIIQNDMGIVPSVLDRGSESDSLLGQQDLHVVRQKPDEENLENRPVKILLEVVMPEGKLDNPILESIDEGMQRKIDANEDLSPVNFELTVGESQVGLIHSSLQAENGTQEEGNLHWESLTPPVEIGTQEEPRRLRRVGSVMSLDEYKRSILAKQQESGNQVDLTSVQTQKMRHSDQSYNYAAAQHGAKLLASNKEAKGATHILVSDKDKYLRNPCGAEDKYVVLELSEETFVDTLVISNFEFHSSNVKDFELLGSPIYPAKEWISLGKFQAENVRHRQKFNIEDPKLVRHLMLKMLTHWGSEFFCTLSVVEVFGVDVIKNLLDDWIALEEVDNNGRTQGTNGFGVSQDDSATAGTALQSGASGDAVTDPDAPFMEPLHNQPAADLGTGLDQGGSGGRDARGKAADGLHADDDSKAGTTADSAQEASHTPGGKPAGDSVLKILMQRVKALELNQTLFDLYLGDMNQKYKVMLSDLDKDLALVTERLRNETVLTASLAMRLADRELQRKEEKLYMEHRFAQIASNFTDNLDFMRWQIQSMERREVAAITLAFLCMILSALLHLLVRFFPRRTTTQDFSVETVGEDIDSKLGTLTLSAVCRTTSTFVLYLASGLTILVLSV